MQKNILAISGSIRKKSTNEAILNAIAIFYSEKVKINIFNRLEELPYFNPDSVKDDFIISDCVIDFRKQIEESDGVIICTPEYVFSLPGVLKNALEWTVPTTVFSYKPFAFIVASASGEKAFESMDLIMRTLLQQPVPEEQKLLIHGGKGKVNEEGELVDENTLKEIRKVVDALIETINYNLSTEN